MHRRLIGTLIVGILGAISFVAYEPLFGGPSVTADDIKTFQEAHYTREGKYLQVLEGSKLPEDEGGTVRQKLGHDLPAGYVVHVYDAPKGHGYQVQWEDADNQYSIGVGPEAADRTWTRPKPPWVASSTPK